MEINKNYLQEKIKQKSTLNERQELIKKFLDRLNTERGDFPPLKPQRIAMILAPIKTKDLYAYYAVCDDATNFSSFFWWRAKGDLNKKASWET